MPVTLSFGNRHNYEVNASRLARLMSPNKEEALYMGLWDRFKDYFRTHKKERCWRYYIHSSMDVNVKIKLNLMLIQSAWRRYMPLHN